MGAIRINWDLVETIPHEEAIDTLLSGLPTGITVNFVGVRPKQRPR